MRDAPRDKVMTARVMTRVTTTREPSIRLKRIKLKPDCFRQTVRATKGAATYVLKHQRHVLGRPLYHSNSTGKRSTSFTLRDDTSGHEKGWV